MPIYFRADERPPEVVFKEGFTPRKEGTGENWWRYALGLHGEVSGKFGIDNRSSDAISEYTVCMSSKLESTPMFPITGGKEIYIYAIALPEATKIIPEKNERNIYLMDLIQMENEKQNYKNSYVFTKTSPLALYYIDQEGEVEKLNIKDSQIDLVRDLVGNVDDQVFYSGRDTDQPILIKPEMDKDAFTFIWMAISSANELHPHLHNVNPILDEKKPTNMEEAIIDLHSLQTMQAKKNIKRFHKTGLFDHHTAVVAGQTLYGYEALAYKVPTTNIIGAVKAERESLNHPPLTSISYPTQTETYEKKFRIVGNITENPNFSSQQTLDIGPKNNSRNITIDYSDDKRNAIKQFENVKNKDIIESTSIYHGLGGKTF